MRGVQHGGERVNLAGGKQGEKIFFSPALYDLNACNKLEKAMHVLPGFILPSLRFSYLPFLASQDILNIKKLFSEMSHNKVSISF